MSKRTPKKTALYTVRRLAMLTAGLVCVAIVVTGCARGAGNGPVVSRSVTDARAIALESAVAPTEEIHGDEELEPPEEEAENDIREPDFNPLEMEYAIEAGDALQFQSFDDPDLSQTVDVRYDGYISLPHIPDIKVDGVTREEATEKVREAYTSVFQDPEISLTIAQSASKSYYVMGDIQSTREFEYDRPINLLQAINRAGGMRGAQRGSRGRDSTLGTTTTGQLTKAFVFRTIEDYRDVLEFDLRNMTEPGSHDSQAPIYPGDVIYIPEGINLVYLWGEVRGAGVYQLSDGMTLMQLMARAGGHSPQTAHTRRVVLMREAGENSTELFLLDYQYMLRTGADVLLEAGDMIYVPRRPVVRLQQFINDIRGTVSPVMSLYTQAVDTYYARDRQRRISRGSSTAADIVNSLDSLQRLGSTVAPLA
ncbi:MAG: polysaccharide biosynthesis/export family protein, partial [Candidatus Hydrogenedentota bacterium]